MADRIDLPDLAPVAVHLHDPGAFRDDFVAVAERERLAEGPADGEHEIRFETEGVGERKRAEAESSEGKRVLFGDEPLVRRRGGERGAEDFGELFQLRFRPRPVHSSARDDDRNGGFVDLAGRALDGGGIGRNRGRRLRRPRRLGKLDFESLHVARHADINRTLSSRRRLSHSFPQGIEGALALQRHAHLGDRREHLALRDLVPGRGALSRFSCPNVGRQGDQWNRFLICVCNSSQKIGRTGAGGGHANSDTSLRLGVGRARRLQGAGAQRFHGERLRGVPRIGARTGQIKELFCPMSPGGRDDVAACRPLQCGGTVQ